MTGMTSYVAKGLLPYHGLGSGIKRALEKWPEIDFADDHEGHSERNLSTWLFGDGGGQYLSHRSFFPLLLHLLLLLIPINQQISHSQEAPGHPVQVSIWLDSTMEQSPRWVAHTVRG